LGRLIKGLSVGLVAIVSLTLASAGSSVSAADALPTFGRPTIVGVQAGGNSEPGLRIDTRGRMYVTSPTYPYSAVWRSLDGGATFKWLPAADAKTGRLAACRVKTGGDSEIATDTADRLYFSDRLAEEASPFNTAARSDDQGRTFRSSCNAVTSNSTDRPWYAVDGDPLGGGNIYLGIAIVRGDTACSAAKGHDQVALARSPVPGRSAEAGVVFGPLVVATGPCAFGSLGTIEVSPTTHDVFVSHSIAADVAKERGADEVRVARCTPVPFGPAMPGGLDCVDLPVLKAQGVYIHTSLTVDRAGNLYLAWYEIPFDATGGSRLFVAASRDNGETWGPRVPIATPGLNTNIWPWVAAGDEGRLGVAWYGTGGVDTDPTRGCGAAADVNTDWGVYFSQSLDALAETPVFSPPLLVSEHFVHRGGIADSGGKFCGNGVMGDFLQLRIGLQGEAVIVYADSNNANGIYAGVNDPNRGQIAHPMLVRQNGGPGLDASQPFVQGKAAATNRVTDEANDATFDARGRVSRSQRNLDILSSSVSRTQADRYRFRLRISDLRSLAPNKSTGNGDTHLVWLVQWLSPSRTDSGGGSNPFVYMESAKGRAPTFWAGESARQTLPSYLAGFTYPGVKRVKGSLSRSAPGTITIEVPASAVLDRSPVSRTLYHVTASTMTLAGPANRPAPNRFRDWLVGGKFFTLIDSAPSYDFVP